MDADNDDFNVASKMIRKSCKIDYCSLSQSIVEEQMEEDAVYICNILGVKVRYVLLRALHALMTSLVGSNTSLLLRCMS